MVPVPMCDELFITPFQSKTAKTGSRFWLALKKLLPLQLLTSLGVIIMVSVAYKNRTRDEIIAAVRESIRKKQEWIKQSDEEFKRIREERKKLAV